MTTLYAEKYAEYQGIMNAYHATEDKDEKERIRQKYRVFKDRIQHGSDAFAKYFWIYADAKKRGNDYIDIHDPVAADKVFEEVRDLKALGFKHFTISSTWSGAIENAWLFNQNGCTLIGMVEINSQYQASYGLDGYEKAHALLFSID